MSSSLVWGIIRKSNAWTVSKKGGDRAIFSKEAGNVMNNHSFKHSGLANPKSFNIDFPEGAKGVSLGVKTRAAGKSPKKAYSTVKLTGGARKTMKAIKSYTDGIHYRKDLQGAALARASQILLSQKNKKPKVRKIKGRKTRAALVAA